MCRISRAETSNFVEKTLPNLFVKIGDTVCADTYGICTIYSRNVQRLMDSQHSLPNENKQKINKKLERKQWTQGDHLARDIREGNWPKVSQVWGKNFVTDKCLLLTLGLGLYQCLVAPCMYVFHSVKYDMGNHNPDRSATQSQGNVRNFTVSGEYLTWAWEVQKKLQSLKALRVLSVLIFWMLNLELIIIGSV